MCVCASRVMCYQRISSSIDFTSLTHAYGFLFEIKTSRYSHVNRKTLSILVRLSWLSIEALACIALVGIRITFLNTVSCACVVLNIYNDAIYINRLHILLQRLVAHISEIIAVIKKSRFQHHNKRIIDRNDTTLFVYDSVMYAFTYVLEV